MAVTERREKPQIEISVRIRGHVDDVSSIGRPAVDVLGVPRAQQQFVLATISRRSHEDVLDTGVSS